MANKFAIGSSWMFVSQVVEQAINLAVFVVLARILGAEEFGLAMMAVAIILVAEYLVAQTVSEGLIQIREIEDGHLDVAFWTLFGLAVVLMALIAIFANLIASFYSQPKVSSLLLGAAPMIFLVAISGVPVTLLRRKLRFGPLAVRAVAGVIGGGVVGILMALSDFGVWSIIGQRLTLLLVNAIIAWMACPWRPGFRSTRKQFDQIIRLGISMVGFRTSELLSLQTPTVALGYFLGPSAVGYYTIAWRLVETALQIIVNTFCSVAHPIFAHLKTDLARAGALLKEILNASTLITFPSFVGLAVVASPLIRSVFGDDWIPSVRVTQILCLVGIFFSVERVQQAFLLAIGETRFLFLQAFSEFLLGVALIVTFGQTSVPIVAAMVVLRYYLLWPLRIAAIKSSSGILNQWYVGAFLPVLLMCGVMAVCVYWAQLTFLGVASPASLTISILLGAGIYSLAVFLFLRARIRYVVRLFSPDLLKGVHEPLNIKNTRNP